MIGKDYGVITDHLAWDLPLTGVTSSSGPFQVFRGSDVSGNKPVPLARSEGVGLYLRRFEEGRGENGLHSHDQDAIWLVLEGAASFYDEHGNLIAALKATQGVLVPELTSYRFVCSERSLLLRFAGAHTE